MAHLQRSKCVFPIPEGAENVLLSRRDDGDSVGDEQGRLFFRDAPHMTVPGQKREKYAL